MLHDVYMSRIVTKEELQHFSKIASDQYLTNGVPMNKTITDISNDNQYLNKEHLKRIIEMSNSNVYQHKYDKESDKNIHFDVADPNQILKEEIEPTKIAYDTSAYSRAPKEKIIEIEKVAELDTDGFLNDSNAAYLSERNRCSSLDLDIQKMADAISSAKNELEFELFSHDLKYKAAMLELNKLAVRYIENGTPVSDVLHAISSADEDSARGTLNHLLDTNTVVGDELSTTKLGYFINPENDLVKVAAKARSHREHIAIYEQAIKEAEYQLELLNEAQ